MASLTDHVSSDIVGFGATEYCGHGRTIALETEPRCVGRDTLRSLAEEFAGHGHQIDRGEHEIVLLAGNGEPVSWFSIDSEALAWWKGNTSLAATFTECSACAPRATEL
ncbi:hypothetical protein [Tsukamurella tyrosinosolvens]|nr:hypothetical protein [Tsukamurella tyrosinosolvens]KXO98401.1 hypothetical protein AXK58_25345 [Tsukamurella tyrosinosolvens]